MENGNVISVRPDGGTEVMRHDIPTSPMARVGRSATTEVVSRRVFFDMWRYESMTVFFTEYSW